MGLDIAAFPEGVHATGYSVAEDITPIDPGSMEGGVGQISFTTNTWRNARVMRNVMTSFFDEERGNFVGEIKSIESNEQDTTFAADNILARFNVEKTTQPYSGPLSGLVREYMDLVGIVADLDYQGPDPYVVALGVVGNVWDMIKNMMAAHQVEMAAVFDTVVVRPLRTRIANNAKTVTRNYSLSADEAALAVQVNYYVTWPIELAEVFPVPGDEEEPTIQQVDANETVTWDIPVNASLRSVEQPEHVYTTGPESRSGTVGVYTVVGNDNLPITPEQWKAEGGWLQTEVAPEDSRIVRVTVRGANNKDLSPFRIAMSAGGTDYNSLHITGTGVAFEPQIALIYTGADPTRTHEEIGQVVENEFITTREMAFVAGAQTAAAYSGFSQTISGDVYDFEFPSYDRKMLSSVIRDFNNETLEQTIAEWNAAHPDLTLEEFNDGWDSRYLKLFDSQTFGNAVGSRLYYNDAYYRITNTNITESSISYSARIDTTIGDFNERWSDATYASTIANGNFEDGLDHWTKVGSFIKDFNEDTLEETIAEWNVTHSGMSIADFNELWGERYSHLFNWEQTSEEAYSGIYSAKFSTVYAASDVFHVYPGQKYLLSYHLKTSAEYEPREAWIGLSSGVAVTDRVDYIDHSETNTGGEWQHFEKEITVPAGVYNMHVMIGWEDGPGEVYLDDVRVVNVSNGRGMVEFNETFANMSLGQFSTMPLWRDGEIIDGPSTTA